MILCLYCQQNCQRRTFVLRWTACLLLVARGGSEVIAISVPVEGIQAFTFWSVSTAHVKFEKVLQTCRAFTLPQ